MEKINQIALVVLLLGYSFGAVAASKDHQTIMVEAWAEIEADMEKAGASVPELDQCRLCTMRSRFSDDLLQDGRCYHSIDVPGQELIDVRLPLFNTKQESILAVVTKKSMFELAIEFFITAAQLVR